MRKEAKLLRQNSVDSLILAIEHFNRPWDRGRLSSVLILLDHSFEQLLKAAILHRGGKIRRPREKQTIGFDECVRKALTDGSVQFLSSEQVLVLQTINGLRDAAYHHLIEISERLLYVQAQSAVTLFRDLLKAVFGTDLRTHLPERVLPVSTSAPVDPVTLFESEVGEVRQLLKPGSRRQIEASARLRALAIVEGAIRGERVQPSQGELRNLASRIRDGLTWERLFPGIASINLTAEGQGSGISLRITKKEGIPIHLVKEGEEGAFVVAVKRVNELDYYSLNLTQVAKKVGLTSPRVLAFVRLLKLQEDADCFKPIQMGKTVFNRYSAKAVDRIASALLTSSADEVWKKHGPRKRGRS